MTLYQYINHDIDRIRKEIKLGLIPCGLLRHWKVYSKYDIYRKMGHTVFEAVVFTSLDMRTSERSVFRTIKRMEAET